MIRASFAVVLFVLVLTTAALAKAPDGTPPTTVRIDAGLVCGQVLDEEAGLRAYKGIPYAAPPIGDLRWRPPRPVKPWPAVRICREFGPACLQPDFRYGPGVDRRRLSEDCLTLNVWTAAKPRDRRPVMVWIHGGGFVIGAGSMAPYDGSVLARRGVVVVTINYRLGPFGFLGHPLLSKESEQGVSGNYGLLDQIEALRWVKRNIAAFGGDPDRVTIFGESAGAVSVSCLMVCPQAKGLFGRAIAQSGGVDGLTRRLKTAVGKDASLETRGERLVKKLGLADADDPIAALRKVEAKAILAAARPAPATMDIDRRYGPVVDGWLLPDEPGKLWSAGEQHDVPFMTGSTADDGGIFSDQMQIRSPLAYRFLVKALYREDAAEVLKHFPAPAGSDPKLVARRLTTVAFFVRSSRSLARSMALVKSPAWLYHFTRVPPLAKRLGIGAAHGLEIPYVFGSATSRMGLVKVDHSLGDVMRECWVRFATTGDPNGEGLPEWPAHDAAGDRHLEFGDTVRIGEKLFAKECDLFERIREKRRGR